jgi:cytochrome c oxidase cbb3-type subunit III
MVRWILASLCFSYAVAQPPAEPVGDPVLGQRLFESQCALCHGQDGSGGRGPSLLRPKLDHAADDAALRKLISQGIQPEMPGAWQLSPREVASVAVYVRKIGTIPVEPLPGDAAKGERVFKATGCSTCHIVRGEGVGFGPELTDIGSRRSAAHLRESVIAPEAHVPEDFLLVELVTSGGATIRGIRLNEDTFSIQIMDGKGAFHSYRISELKELRKLRGKSPMPSYKNALSSEELTDLTAYLANLRAKT